MNPSFRKQEGFTLIELLIVVAIIGILAAIAIPNLLMAMQRSKQKRTMADIRSIATAWEARATDVNSYTSAGMVADATWTPVGMSAVTYETLSAQLTPTYIRAIPANDGWDNPLGFAAGTGSYLVASPGKDGAPDGTWIVGPTKKLECDIVYSNGSFVCWPEGVQTSGGEAPAPSPV